MQSRLPIYHTPDKQEKGLNDFPFTERCVIKSKDFWSDYGFLMYFAFGIKKGGQQK